MVAWSSVGGGYRKVFGGGVDEPLRGVGVADAVDREQREAGQEQRGLRFAELRHRLAEPRVGGVEFGVGHGHPFFTCGCNARSIAASASAASARRQRPSTWPSGRTR